MFRPIRILTLTALLVAAAIAPSAAHGKAAVGISDNKPVMFGDNDFKALGVKDVRIVVSWDVASPTKAAGRAETAEVDQWMKAARAGGYRILVAFEKSKSGKKVPTPKKYLAQIKKFKKKYSFVKQVSPWNEGNYTNKPKRVAEYTKGMKKACKGCKIVTDVVDKPNLIKWTKQYMKAMGSTKTKFWGLHNYVDVNNFTNKRTKAFLKVTKKGDVWLTETGGVANRANPGSSFAGTGITHMTNATTYLFDKIVKPTKRIKKVFIYHWNNETLFSSGFASWDSGLKDADGTLRPAYQVVKANK